MFFGSIVFRFFGVLLRWVVINFYALFTRKEKRKRFTDIWKGKQDNYLSSDASYEMSNILIGVIFILIVCTLLIFFDV